MTIKGCGGQPPRRPHHQIQPGKHHQHQDLTGGVYNL